MVLVISAWGGDDGADGALHEIAKCVPTGGDKSDLI